MLPSKKAIVGGLLVSALFMLAYNKIPAIKRVLGG